MLTKLNELSGGSGLGFQIFGEDIDGYILSTLVVPANTIIPTALTVLRSPVGAHEVFSSVASPSSG